MEALILTQLEAREVVAGEWRERRGALAAVHHELAPGAFIHITLGPAGLLVYHGDVAVGIPMADLLKLVIRHEPAFTPPKPEPPAPGAGDIIGLGPGPSPKPIAMPSPAKGSPEAPTEV